MSKKSNLANTATLILAKQLKELQKNPVEGFSGNHITGLADESNLFEWDLLVYGPPDTIFEGGLWKATLSFPQDFPDHPPVMQFKTEIWHPNIYKDGKVCISILHSGEDEFGYEKSSERWNPILSVEAVIEYNPKNLKRYFYQLYPC